MRLALLCVLSASVAFARGSGRGGFLHVRCHHPE